MGKGKKTILQEKRWTMPKVLSVLIPTYNMEKYLARCLNSLLVESSEELLEVLVINDGSKDSSSKIAHSFAEKYPAVFRAIDKENGNYGSCINRGLKEATGKYVKVLDSDDYFERGNFDEFLKAISRIDVDMVLSDTLRILENGTVLRKDIFPIPPFQKLPFGPYQNLQELLMHCVAYRRQILVDMQYTQTEGISYTDTEWAFYPVSRVETIFYFDKPVYKYLLGRSGQTVDPKVFRKGLPQRMAISRRMVDFWESHQNEKAQVYLDQYLLLRLQREYKRVLLEGGDLSELLEFDRFVQEHSPKLYELLGKSTFGRREKIPFIRDFRKCRKASFRFRFFAALHRILGRHS